MKKVKKRKRKRASMTEHKTKTVETEEIIKKLDGEIALLQSQFDELNELIRKNEELVQNQRDQRLVLVGQLQALQRHRQILAEE